VIWGRDAARLRRYEAADISGVQPALQVLFGHGQTRFESLYGAQTLSERFVIFIGRGDTEGLGCRSARSSTAGLLMSARDGQVQCIFLTNIIKFAHWAKFGNAENRPFNVVEARKTLRFRLLKISR
jgi:hypothetical protein